MVSRIKELWRNEQGLQSAAALLVITMFLSNVLGFLRDLILANSIPLDTLDTYYAAFRIPDLLFNLFILGAISSAFIPVFLDVKVQKDEEASWRLAHNLVHTALFALAILGLVLFFAMPYILPIFIPGFPESKLLATIPLARVLLLSPFFFAVSYIVGGVLNAHKKFFAYALAPLVYNLSIIVGGFLTPYYGVYGVAWAVIIGALGHALVQLPTLWSLGYRYQFVLDLKDKELRRVIRLMIPRSFSLGMTQLVLVFFTRIGSLLPSGSVSIFTLTNNVQTTPVAIFAASIATAVFPLLGEAHSEKNDDRFRTLLTKSLQGMLFYMIPTMILLWVFRAHIIRLYLALNHQTWADTIRAIQTFSWFILALVAQGFNLVMIRAFYGRQDTRRPMYISIFAGVLSVGLAWVLARWYSDVPSLSLAFAIGVNVEAVLLLVVFILNHKKLIDFPSLFNTLFITILFSLAAGLSSRLALSVISEGAFTPLVGLGTERIVAVVLDLFAAGLIGVLVYVFLSLITHRDEFYWIIPKKAAQTVPLPEGEEIATDEGLT